VAIAEVHGPRAGVEAVETVQKNRQLESNDLLYAVLAEFESQLNDLLAAASLDSIIARTAIQKGKKGQRIIDTLRIAELTC
jgi:predicted RNA polymerase sigma factor